MNRSSAVVALVLVTAGMSWERCAAQGPVPVELIDDPRKPNCFQMRMVRVHAADGEPIPIEPAENVFYDAALRKLSVAQAMARLAELTSGKLSLQTPAEVMARCKEFHCLAAIVARHDVGSLARVKAIHRMMRAFEAAGGNPLELGYSRPMARVSGFRSAPVLLASGLTSADLSKASVRFLEEAFKSEFERTAADPKYGLIFSHQTLGSPPVHARFYVDLIKSILSSGFASPTFAAWVRDQFVEDLRKKLRDPEVRSVVQGWDLKLIAHAGALESNDMSPLLDLAGTELLQGPVDRRYAVYELIKDLTLLPGFQEQHGVRLLSLVDEAVRLDPSWSRLARSIVSAVLSRFDAAKLYPEQNAPEVVKKYGKKTARARTREPTSLNFRISTVRFVAGDEPKVLFARVGAVDSPEWTMYRCGEKESGGLAALRHGGGLAEWSFHHGERRENGYLTKFTTNELPSNQLLHFRLYSKPWDDWQNLPDTISFDCQFLELRVEAFGRKRPSPVQILSLVVDIVPVKLELARPLFKWMEQSSNSAIRDALIALALQEDSSQNWVATRAASLLVKRGDLRAIGELIPELLKFKKCLPTPVMDVFYSLVDRKDVPDDVKHAWAAEMIRQHLNGPIGEWRAKAVMKVATRLSGESFGFIRKNTGQENRVSFQQAQAWAWRQPSTDP